MKWSSGLLLRTLGILTFSGTLPATRLAVSSFGPFVLPGEQVSWPFFITAIVVLVSMAVCLRSRI